MAKKGENPLAKEALLLSAREAARLLGMSRSHFYGLHSSGRLGPMPIRLGRRTLWRIDELRSWTEQNCPAREKWIEMGKDGTRI